jgi:hypothetical protein
MSAARSSAARSYQVSISVLLAVADGVARLRRAVSETLGSLVGVGARRVAAAKLCESLAGVVHGGLLFWG